MIIAIITTMLPTEAWLAGGYRECALEPKQSINRTARILTNPHKTSLLFEPQRVQRPHDEAGWQHVAEEHQNRQIHYRV